MFIVGLLSLSLATPPAEFDLAERAYAGPFYLVSSDVDRLRLRVVLPLSAEESSTISDAVKRLQIKSRTPRRLELHDAQGVIASVAFPSKAVVLDWCENDGGTRMAIHFDLDLPRHSLTRADLDPIDILTIVGIARSRPGGSPLGDGEYALANARVLWEDKSHALRVLRSQSQAGCGDALTGPHAFHLQSDGALLPLNCCGP